MIVCMRSVNSDGKTIGYVKFDSPKNKEDRTCKEVWAKFQKSLLLNGLELRLSSDPELRWIMPNGERRKRVSNKIDSSYPIDVLTICLSEDKIKKIKSIFKDISSDDCLYDMGCTLMKNKEIGGDVADFFFYWIKFNTIYNQISQRYESKRIENYVGNLNAPEINLIYAKHEDLFDALSKAKIYARRGNSRSDSLTQALGTNNKTKIVKLATLCVYELRNKFVHEGKFNFKDIGQAMIFIRDLTYVELLMKYDYMIEDIDLSTNQA